MKNETPLIFSLYLPQFHAIPENDAWWGEGFTDWENVKRALPLFDGHNQPRIPFNNNYYDLKNTDELYRQSLLATEFGVGGFCFYHYWFEGKKLLETPIENYRDDKRITLPYFLCWANHTWLNSWGAPRVQDEILIKQRYGNEEIWEQHFNYLLDFFNDSKYMRINDKPVFMIYMPHDIPRIEKMITMWNKSAIENGIDGIYFIQMNTFAGVDHRTNLYDAIVDFEPLCTWGGKGNMVSGTLTVYDYDLIYEEILNRTNNRETRVFHGAFPDWDNTARKGMWGALVEGATPDKFENYIFALLKKSHIEKNELLLINAWNEWAEGTYLEPDEKNGTAYLQAIKNALKSFDSWKLKQELESIKSSDRLFYRKTYDAYDLTAKWLISELDGLKMIKYFETTKFANLAIYGAGNLGMALIKALEDSKLNICYVIDKNAKFLEFNKHMRLVGLHEIMGLESVDAIIVTVVNGFYDIYHDIKSTGTEAEIISINAIIESL